jgi:isoleucyl-tRNA synthetase
LNTEVTQVLKNEGLAREIIRNVQSARKEAKLQVENRIKIALFTDSEQLNAAIKQCQNIIAAETLTEDFSVVQKPYAFTKTVKIENDQLVISLEKA